ncbi:MAG TPA: YigZ family protein [Candidatus Bathyarchaeia archaeon]|nr:YigZ family protein [Candidatus Bathyarchaeia archaeon]
MKSIKESARGLKQIEKKSIFICTLFKISTKEEAEHYLQRIKIEFVKASHNAFAYRIGHPVTWEESSDDGEVKGCAGKPLMDILRKKELTNILVIVTRFYGGVNLGTGGLIRNYSKSALELIDKVGIIEL